MGKHAKEKDTPKEQKEEPTEDRPEYEELVERVSTIAQPLASKKLTKKIYKTVKKASKSKSLRRGVKEVQKCIRKGEKGLVVMAGDISPIDVISHLPVFCEENKLPYCYVPAKIDLGAASCTKRPTSIVLIKRHDEFAEGYDECQEGMKALPPPLIS
ncbi:H/ACA ribonucleoprotein complex subunit 2-like protein [Sycon ciliatum]|uniref:H/ACA ribonucleoprotein complex subunit 2-like protein n=1 Tax=Sycon ciliatum TaxID=27933 RepID=UPI0020ADFAAE|eukprot:scpid60540/ scgid24296/ H/ACA ribonucleoprotein complex subunit 2; Nucleolar protein family A member 2; snoRNP protein NHP2